MDILLSQNFYSTLIILLLLVLAPDDVTMLGEALSFTLLGTSSTSTTTRTHNYKAPAAFHLRNTKMPSKTITTVLLSCSNSPDNDNTFNIHHYNNNTQKSLPTSCRDYIIVSFDGVLADTSRQQAMFTLEVALRIWPHLQGLLRGGNYKIHTIAPTSSVLTIEEEEDGWLLNKMVACAHVTRDHTHDGMLGCDDVLLARLLIEEQQLVEKKTSSLGKGKYASKFHPKVNQNQKDDDSVEGDDDSSSTTESSKRNGHSRSRPLTVGEICANWNTGGHLRDTLRTRYNIGGKDPIPRIREEISTWLTDNNNNNKVTVPKPTIPPLIKEALLFGCSSGKNIYILLSHMSYIKQALNVLSDFTVEVCLPDTTTVCSSNDASSSTGRLHILVGNTEQKETHVALIQDLMEHASDYSEFFVIHSNTNVLHDAKNLLDGDSPYTMKAKRKTRIGNHRSLALFLPTWGVDSFTSKNDVELDPWVTIIDEIGFMELLTANKILNIT